MNSEFMQTVKNCWSLPGLFEGSAVDVLENKAGPYQSGFCLLTCKWRGPLNLCWQSPSPSECLGLWPILCSLGTPGHPPAWLWSLQHGISHVFGFQWSVSSPWCIVPWPFSRKPTLLSWASKVLSQLEPHTVKVIRHLQPVKEVTRTWRVLSDPDACGRFSFPAPCKDGTECRPQMGKEIFADRD